MADVFDLVRKLGQRLDELDSVLTQQVALANDHHRRRTPAFWLANIGAHLGDSLLWGAITALLWRRAGRNPGRRRQLGGWLISFAGALLVTLGIKRVFKRRRPGGGRFLYGRGADVHSFPSGHGARSGVILIWASILHPLLGKWAPLLVLWIGWSRVAIGVHYVGDVVVGFLLGLGLGQIVETIWKPTNQES
jgi:undecaprenyl-diphosphatase